MLKKILFVFTFAFLVFLPGLVRAEEVLSFDVTAEIKEDASVYISETIQYDFGSELKHGIFRNIPYKYPSKAGNYNLRLSDVLVTDENGQALTFTVSKQGSDTIIKIGDADVEVSGRKTYIINYKVEGAINYFENDDEFYWNVTGNQWPVAIKSASATILLPAKTDLATIKFSCYAGPIGDGTACENKKLNNLAYFTVYFSQKNLAIGSGLTVAVSFPKGILHEPTQAEKILSFLVDNPIVGLPFLVLTILLFLWRKYGKDPSGQGVIVAQFDSPDNLTPLEVGVVVDERAHHKDISAEIINLAVRGYLKINRIEKEGLLSTKHDYEFEQLKTAKDLPNEHEKTLMAMLFSTDENTVNQEKVLLSSLEKSANTYNNVKKIDTLINDELVSKGYFKSNPHTVRRIYLTVGAVVIFLGFFLFSLSIIVSGLIVIIFSRWMPAKTKKGVLAKEYIFGLKNYLQVAEADRLKFHNAPEKNPQTFEKLLPFAMVLGVEKQWAKQFESIYLAPPSWYQGTSMNHFSVMMLATDFGDLNSRWNHAFNSSRAVATGKSGASFGGRGSSGGGFSGGGFGGGGGGSW